MKGCVIFNPAARGDKARRFQDWLQAHPGGLELRPTPGPGTARSLACQAAREGFPMLVAAGGDGTINEVVNGLVDAGPEAAGSVRLGILALGTANVFAQELGLALELRAALSALDGAASRWVWLPRVEFRGGASGASSCFIQTAGAGLDSFAVERVQWNLKKRIGQAAYVVSALRVWARGLPMIRVDTGGNSFHGQQILFGAGRYYAGRFLVFPEADHGTGTLQAAVVPRITLARLLSATCGAVCNRLTRLRGVRWMPLTQAALSSQAPVPVELDGDVAGHLPATITACAARIRVITPP